MGAATTPVDVVGKLRLNDRPLETGQDILALAERQADLLKSIAAFLETDDGVVGDRVTMVVKNPKLNRKAHPIPPMYL